MSNIGGRRPTRAMTNLNIGGAVPTEDKPGTFRIRSHKRMGKMIRPHRPFRNWVQGYKLPWIAFLEIAMMIIYFMFGLVHQRSSIDFALDITQAVDDYFLDGYDFDDGPENSHSSVGKIYFKDQFIEVAQSTGDRLHKFTQDFPCSKPFFSDQTYNAKITTLSGDSISCQFSTDNSSLLTYFLRPFIEEFAQMVLTMNYHIQVDIGAQDARLEVQVSAEFTLMHNADVIVLDMFHTRSPRRSALDIDDISTNTLIIFPIMNVILGIICILMTVFNLHEVYLYTQTKAERNFQGNFSVYLNKFDGWSVFALVSHSFTIAASVLYALKGQEVHQDVPNSLILLSISSSLHCLLLIRYLKQKPSTMIVVNVIFDAGITLLQFLAGCIIVFVAYLILGCSLFGTFTPNFATFIQGAVVLIAVTQGDSIQDMFDTVSVRADCPWWWGFIYMTIWVFFSLTILFNITISIFERSLTREIFKLVSPKEPLKETSALTMNHIEMSIPLAYR